MLEISDIITDVIAMMTGDTIKISGDKKSRIERQMPGTLVHNSVKISHANP